MEQPATSKVVTEEEINASEEISRRAKIDPVMEQYMKMVAEKRTQEIVPEPKVSPKCRNKNKRYQLSYLPT